MKPNQTIRLALMLGVLGALWCAGAQAQTMTQSINVHAGWNSIYLEVEPADNTTASVFAGRPVSSVWARAERVTSADFIQDASEENFNRAGWLSWFAPSRPEAILDNLFVVQANHAYLIKADSAFTLTVTGRPSLRRVDWVSDSYNLRGMPVDPAAPPSFLNFFRASPAHYHEVTGELEKIYRLNSASGQWELAAPTDRIQSGEAYWIFARGASDFLAPLSAEVDLGDGLDFGTDLTELTIRIKNGTSSLRTALVDEIGGATGGILSYYQFDPSVGGRWPALPAPLVLDVAPGTDARLRLGAARQRLNGALYQSVCEIRDGIGTRLLIPIRVEKPAQGPALRQGSMAAASAANALAGLWVGSAVINAVSEPHSANPTVPTPTKSELNLRLIIHVDAAGQARLLKEVLQMWRDGTYTNDASGNRVPDQPGEYVLLTDDALISQFTGAALRDGVPVGRRVSSVGYDFQSPTTNNYLALSGAFAIGQSLSATLTLPYDYATNPFLHRYHPDHDNLNARYDGPAVESYTTTRQIRLDFAASPPAGPAKPDFGYNEMGGAYRETVTGIHKSSIYLSGTFRLLRVSLVSQLNPNPNP